MNDAWKASASNAITNLVDLGTNTLTGLAQGAKDKLQGTSTNIPSPQQIYPAAQTSDNNVLWLIAAGAVLYLVLKKK